MDVPEPLLAPEDDLGLLCLVVANGFSEAVLQRLASAGFGDARMGHGYIVQGLLAGDRTVSQLADRLGITVQAVSKTVLEMEQLGYIARERDPADGRSWVLRLSARAEESVSESRRARLAVATEVAAALGEERVSELLEQLRSVASLFGGLYALASRRVRPSG